MYLCPHKAFHLHNTFQNYMCHLDYFLWGEDSIQWLFSYNSDPYGEKSFQWLLLYAIHVLTYFHIPSCIMFVILGVRYPDSEGQG